MSSENLSNDVLNLLNRLSNNDEEKIKELILTDDLVKTMFRSPARNVSTTVDDELKKLRESIDQIISKCEFPGCGDVRKRLENFYKKLKKINEFPELYKQQIISVVGAFSAGKSAFLKRCLLEPNEKDISLPVDTEPSTAILTYIDLSDRDKSSSEIVWTDHHGRFHPLQKNEMKKFSHTTEEKMAVPEDFFPTIVKDLRISLPVEKWNKLIFIDTPGFNNTNHEDKSLMDAAIRQTDHVIWVINGNEGAIKQDCLRGLKELLKEKIPVYLLITHLERSPEKRKEFLEIQKKHLPELKEENITFAIIPEEKEKVYKWFDSIQKQQKKVSFISEFNEICDSLIYRIDEVKNNVNQDIEHERIKSKIGNKKDEVIHLIKELLKNLDICDDSQEKTSYYAYFRGQKNWENNTFEGNVDRILELLPGFFCCILTVPAISNIELITDFDFAKKLVDNGMVKNKIKLSFDHSDNENCVFRIDCDEDISENQSQEVELKKKLVSVLKPRIDSNCGVNADSSSADSDDILPFEKKMRPSERLLYFSVFAILAYKKSFCNNDEKEYLNQDAEKHFKLPSKTVSDFLKKLWNNPNSDFIFTKKLRNYVFGAFCRLVKKTNGACIKKDITDILTKSSIPEELVSTYPQYILAYPKANEPMRREIREIEEYVPGKEVTDFLSIIKIFTPEWKFTDLAQQAPTPSSSETEVQYYSVNETRTFKDCVNFKNMVFLFGPKGKFVFQNNCSFTCCRFIASSNHDKKPSGSPLLELKCKQASFENCGFYGRDVRYGIEGKPHKVIKMINCVMSHLQPTGDEACIESDDDDSSFDNCFFCDCKGKYMIYRGSVRNSIFENCQYWKRLINKYGKNNQYNNIRVI